MPRLTVVPKLVVVLRLMAKQSPAAGGGAPAGYTRKPMTSCCGVFFFSRMKFADNFPDRPRALGLRVEGQDRSPQDTQAPIE